MGGIDKSVGAVLAGGWISQIAGAGLDYRRATVSECTAHACTRPLRSLPQSDSIRRASLPATRPRAKQKACKLSLICRLHLNLAFPLQLAAKRDFLFSFLFLPPSLPRRLAVPLCHSSLSLVPSFALNPSDCPAAGASAPPPATPTHPPPPPPFAIICHKCNCALSTASPAPSEREKKKKRMGFSHPIWPSEAGTRGQE